MGTAEAATARRPLVYWRPGPGEKQARAAALETSNLTEQQFRRIKSRSLSLILKRLNCGGLRTARVCGVPWLCGPNKTDLAV